MKALYVSPLFSSLDGAPRKFMIDVAGIKSHASRDAAVMKMMKLGGIHAKDTPEVRKLTGTIRRAKSKIQKNGWFSTPVM